MQLCIFQINIISKQIERRKEGNKVRKKARKQEEGKRTNERTG